MLAVNWRKILVSYRQVRRRRVAARTRLCPAGALAIGGFGRKRTTETAAPARWPDGIVSAIDSMTMSAPVPE